MPYRASGPASGNNVIWSWNETDVTQFRYDNGATGKTGVLSKSTSLEEPYQPILQYDHTGGIDKWVSYVLLDDQGNDLLLPARYVMRFRMGSRNGAGENQYGDNTIPGVTVFYQAYNRQLWISRSSATESDGQLNVVNDEDLGANIYGFKGIANIGPNNDYGDTVFLDMISRHPAVGVSPAGEFSQTSTHGLPDSPSFTGGYAALNSATVPTNEAAWAAGWEGGGDIKAAITFYEFSADGEGFISELAIHKHPLDY